MQLKEFLLTADADHNIALQQAKDYQPSPYLWRIEGGVRKTQVETALIINNTEERLIAFIADTNNPAPAIDLAKKVLRALQKLYEPEFYINLADPEVSTMFTNAQNYGILNSDESTRITAAAYYEPAKPFPSVTLHDVLVARNACPNIEILGQGQWAVMTTTTSCPLHNPRLLALNTNTNKKEQINNFTSVSVAGTYEARIPNEYIGRQLFVDNPYGAI